MADDDTAPPPSPLDPVELQPIGVVRSTRDEAVPVDDVMVVERNDGTVVRVLGSGVPGDPAWDPVLRRWRGTWAVGLAALKRMLERPAAGSRTVPE